VSDDGVVVALTPVQLSLIFDGREVSSGQMLTTRLWGGAKALFGVIELIGAGALLVAPDPTLLTKAGAVGLGGYGIDSLQSGARQLWSGQETETLTYHAAVGTALGLGASEEAAEQIGRGFDIAVPVTLSLGLGALKIAAIRGGRVALIEHEALAGSKIGGHTILKHVAKTDAELFARLAQTQKGGPKIVSTFASLEAAERAVYQTLRANRAQIAKWAHTASPGATQAFELQIAGVGRGAVRSTGNVVTLNAVRMVMKKEAYNGKLYYILTSFPIP
jgi:Bacterial CdiA-CT RNAse A domain